MSKKKLSREDQLTVLEAQGDWVLELLMEIDVPIFTALDDHYISFISDLDVCNDGTGPKHGDQHYQPMTAYNPYLNADKDPYLVTPPQIRLDIGPVVLGCLGRITRLDTGEMVYPCVVGEVGPDDKTGEAAYCVAKAINPKITHTSGDSRRIYLYEFWPDIPCPGYKLQPC